MLSFCVGKSDKKRFLRVSIDVDSVANSRRKTVDNYCEDKSINKISYLNLF